MQASIPSSPPPGYDTPSAHAELATLSPEEALPNDLDGSDRSRPQLDPTVPPPPSRPILLTRITSSASDELHEDELEDETPFHLSQARPSPQTSRHPPTHTPILLLDNTLPLPTSLSPNTQPSSPRPFASSVTIPSYTIVSPSRTLSLTQEPDASCWVVYDLVIGIHETGGVIKERKRFSEFWMLKESVRREFRHIGRATVPSLPPKNSLSKFRPSFLEKRRVRLQEWLRIVLLHPEIGCSPIVKEWLLQ